MENLYIKINNGQPVNHPTTEENLLQAFGSIPSNWSPFTRILQPQDLLTSPFQKAVNTYGLSSDGVTWQDVWTPVEMTSDEQQALIEETQAHPPWLNAILNTKTLTWRLSAPPKDGQNYLFNFLTNAWEVVPLKPTDGQEYYFDWTTKQWLVIPSTT